jgi:hypothetical protein
MSTCTYVYEQSENVQYMDVPVHEQLAHEYEHELQNAVMPTVVGEVG